MINLTSFPCNIAKNKVNRYRVSKHRNLSFHLVSAQCVITIKSKTVSNLQGSYLGVSSLISKRGTCNWNQSWTVDTAMVNNHCASVVQFWTKQLSFFSTATCRKQPKSFKLEPLDKNYHIILCQYYLDSSCQSWWACSWCLAPHQENFICPKSYSLPLILSSLFHILLKTQIILCQSDTVCPSPLPCPLAFFVSV